MQLPMSLGIDCVAVYKIPSSFSIADIAIEEECSL